MKKRWLVMITSCMMAIILCFGFAACGDNKTEKPSDTAATVRTVENAIKMMYAEKSTGSQSYSVAGRWRVGDGEYCDITWTATTKTDGIKIEDYVTIGTRDATTYDVPITIKQGTVDITYTLNGAFTIDGVQGNASFDKTIPALKTATNDGSAEHPFTISDVFIIADTLSNGGFYQKDGKNARVYIKGIVVSPGSFQGAKGDYPDELASVQIADEAGDTANAVSIAYIVFTDYFKNPGNKSNPLSKGDTITVLAFIERYKDKPSIYYAKEDPNDTSAQTLYPEITEWVKAPKTDAELVAEAKEDFALAPNVFDEAKDYDLPATSGEVAITWKLKATSDIVEITTDKKLKVKSLPTANTDVALVATFTKGTEHADLDVTVTVRATNGKGMASNPYTVPEAIEVVNKLADNGYYGGDKNHAAKVYVTGYVVSTNTMSSYGNFNSFNIAASANETTAVLAVYGLNLNKTGDFFTKEGDLVKGAQITVYGAFEKYVKSDKVTPELTFAGDLKVYASSYTDPRTDQQKVDAAVAAVEFEKNLTEDLALPEAGITGVTFTWSVTAGQTAATVEENKLLKITRGTDDVQVTLSLSAECGTTEKKTKTETYTFTVKANAPLEAGNYEANLNLSTNFGTYAANGWGSYGQQKLDFATIEGDSATATKLVGNVVLSNTMKQGNTISDRPVLAAKSSAPAYVTVTVDNANITSVKFTLKMWTAKKLFSKIVIETTTDGTTWTPVENTAVTDSSNGFAIADTGDDANNVFELTGIAANVTAVRLSITAKEDSNTQVGLTSVEIKANVPAAATASAAPVALLPRKDA